MLKDRFFYPLALALIAAMIWFALSLSKAIDLTDETIWRDGFTTQGDKLITLTASPGTKYDFIGETPAAPAYITAFTEIPRKTAPPSAGVFAALSSDYERAFAGQKLRITIRARQGRNNPLKEFDMGYFTAGTGDSGWRRKVLADEWKDYTLEFTPGLRKGDPDIDYFGFWPGEEGEQKTMDIQFLKIDVLSKS